MDKFEGPKNDSWMGKFIDVATRVAAVFEWFARRVDDLEEAALENFYAVRLGIAGVFKPRKREQQFRGIVNNRDRPTRVLDHKFSFQLKMDKFEGPPDDQNILKDLPEALCELERLMSGAALRFDINDTAKSVQSLRDDFVRDLYPDLALRALDFDSEPLSHEAAVQNYAKFLRSKAIACSHLILDTLLEEKNFEQLKVFLREEANADTANFIFVCLDLNSLASSQFSPKEKIILDFLRSKIKDSDWAFIHPIDFGEIFSKHHPGGDGSATYFLEGGLIMPIFRPKEADDSSPAGYADLFARAKRAGTPQGLAHGLRRTTTSLIL